MESDLKLPEGETPVYSRNRKVTITKDSGGKVEKIERDTVLTTNGESQFTKMPTVKGAVERHAVE